MAPKRKPLRAAVIGTGMGRYHMQAYVRHPRVDLVAVCDLNETEAKEFAQQFGAEFAFADYREMLQNVELDVLSVCVPNHLHAAMTIAGLQAGCHVLCEKPMATRLRDAERMVETAAARGKRLMINMSQRFDPLRRTLRDLVRSGKLGKVYYAKSGWIRRKGTPVLDFPPGGNMGRGAWFVDKRQAGGGALMDIGVHIYDLCWWIMGRPEPVTVLASEYNELSLPRFRERRVFADVEDLASALIKFADGSTLFCEVSWDAHMEPGQYLEIFGTEGGIQWRGEARLYYDSRGKPTSRQIKPRRTTQETPYEHFVAACLNPKRRMMCSGQECLSVMRVLDAIDRSANTGKAVRV
ncbi:MAG: Gfo/Idh/MocA family protein [Armatimonadota bacterium]